MNISKCRNKITKSNSICLASSALAAFSLLSVVSAAAEVKAPDKLTVELEGLTAAGYLPVSSAFCMPAGLKPQNVSPGLHWSAGPSVTRSYVVIMVDPDVTTNLALMNKPGVTIAADSPRMNIYHWELINIPADVHRLASGDDSGSFVPGGKPIGPSKYGIRGTNDYWPYFNIRPSAPPVMHGPYGGYDGPCPPSNDEKIHDYKFIVYALDVASLPLSGQFFFPEIDKAMQGHVVARGEAHAKFTFDGK
jgi:Raf kinase inhibitor-like YbhB/YbcL family protein